MGEQTPCTFNPSPPLGESLRARHSCIIKQQGTGTARNLGEARQITHSASEYEDILRLQSNSSFQNSRTKLCAKSFYCRSITLT